MLTWILIIGGGMVLLLMIVGVVISATGERTLVEERLEHFLEEERTEEEKKAERAVLTEWVSKRVEQTTFGERVARDLARADMKLKTAEYFSLIFISIVGVSAITGLLGGRHPISFMIGALVGALLPRMYINRQQRRRLAHFNDQLPDMINLMVNGLRAGYSTVMAMEAVSRELPSPISDEFRRVVQEIQIGIPMERALDNLLRRIPSQDLDFLVTAINVQREVGGNLSEILDTISFTIRERVRIKGEIRVLTAQVRTSGTVLALIPIILVVILWFLNRDYMMAFFLRGALCGGSALGLAGVLIGLGYFIMMRIADIEV